MIYSILLVACGGAIGAALRFTVGLGFVRLFSGNFPMGIIPVNIFGSFLMGAFVVFAHHKGYSAANLFVMTGILGGFTTFSAFSLEAFTLFERGQMGSAALYVVVSVIGSLAALVGGVALSRAVFA